MRGVCFLNTDLIEGWSATDAQSGYQQILYWDSNLHEKGSSFAGRFQCVYWHNRQSQLLTEVNNGKGHMFSEY